MIVVVARQGQDQGGAGWKTEQTFFIETTIFEDKKMAYEVETMAKFTGGSAHGDGGIQANNTIARNGPLTTMLMQQSSQIPAKGYPPCCSNGRLPNHCQPSQHGIGHEED